MEKQEKLLNQLGIYGFDLLEQVILASLVSEAPLLLIGRSGNWDDLSIEEQESILLSGGKSPDTSLHINDFHLRLSALKELFNLTWTSQNTVLPLIQQCESFVAVLPLNPPGGTLQDC